MKTNSKQPLSRSNQVNKNYFGLASSPHLLISLFLSSCALHQKNSLMTLFPCVGCCTCPFLLSSQSSAPHISLLRSLSGWFVYWSERSWLYIRPILLPTALTILCSAVPQSFFFSPETYDPFVLPVVLNILISSCLKQG